MPAEAFYRLPEKERNENVDIENQLLGVIRHPIMTPLEYFSPFRQTCIDLQHQVCLGTTFKFFEDLIHSGEFGNDEKKLFHGFLFKIQLPSIFPRDPRPIEEYKRFHANEWYTLITLTSVPALHSAGVTGERFKLIARFAAFIQLVLSPYYNVTMEDTVASDMIQLAYDCQKHLGVKFMSFNFHQIMNHLLDGIYEIGPLHITSCFVHESFMGIAGRMQKQFYKPHIEISRKLTLLDAADLMEEFVTKPSPSDDVQELRFARRTRLRKNCRLIEESGRKIYVLGSGTNLDEYLQKFQWPVWEKEQLKDIILAEYGADWEDRLELTVYKSAISKNDFRIDLRLFSDAAEEKKRLDCCVQLSDGVATIILAIIGIKSSLETEKMFIYGKQLTEKRWDYFGLKDVLQLDIYKKFYRCVDEEPNKRVFTSIFNVELPVCLFKNCYDGTVIAPVFLPVPD